MRKEFEKQVEAIKTKPLPVMLIGGVDTRQVTQDSANDKWKHLADEMGFVWDSVRPVPGKGERFFTAETAKDDVV